MQNNIFSIHIIYKKYYPIHGVMPNYVSADNSLLFVVRALYGNEVLCLWLVLKKQILFHLTLHCRFSKYHFSQYMLEKLALHSINFNVSADYVEVIFHIFVDINECEAAHLNKCAYECSNTAGGYECVCEDGHTLDTDGFTCIRTYVIIQQYM